MSQLYPIGKPRMDAKADVVFVHGLGGHHQHTWLSSGQSAEDGWPRWLAADLPDANVWSLGYRSTFSLWLGSAMGLYDLARNVLEGLRQGRIAERPTVFLCHSRGGLLVKKILHHLAGSGSAADQVPWTSTAARSWRKRG